MDDVRKKSKTRDGGVAGVVGKERASDFSSDDNEPLSSRKKTGKARMSTRLSSSNTPVSKLLFFACLFVYLLYLYKTRYAVTQAPHGLLP